MRIKATSRGGLIRPWAGRLSRVDPVRAVGLLVALGVALVLVGRLTDARSLAAQASARARTVLRLAVAHWTARPDEIQIDLAHQHFQHLSYRRDAALAAGVLVSSPDDLVPATIRHGDERVRVKLRLKGDLSDHWQDDEKWSFRVVTRGETTLFGMKQFSLQHPRTRGYLREWLVHEALRREGLPALRYDFIRVGLNGRDLGVYALEEHFEKRLVEHAGRREGPIVRFNEDPCWEEVRSGLRDASGAICLGSGSGSYLASEVDGFQTNEQLADPARVGMFVKALHLLDAFRREELPTSEVFDTALLARSFALLELFDAVHASYWRNARFYYNPVTSRLEPIAFDAGGEAQPSTPALLPALSAVHDTRDRNLYHYHLRYFDALFRDPRFYASYVAELERVSAPGFLEQLLEALRPELEQKLRVLHTEFPDVDFDEEALLARRRWIRGWLAPPILVQAHLHARTPEALEVSVGNVQYLDVEVLGLRGDGTLVAPEAAPALLPARSAWEPVDFRVLRFPVANGADPQDVAALRVVHRIVGASSPREQRVLPWPESEPLAADILRAPPNARDFEFLAFDEETREIRLRPGRWRLARDLIVPAGHRLRAGPGTHLDLVQGAMLLSRSPLELFGSEEAPVVIASSDGSGQGLAVIGAGAGSSLEHVRFEGLAAPQRNGWSLTGAVTFYESPVAFSRVEFAGSRAEDALNLVRSDFEISEGLFRDSASDALDVDFCRGRIEHTVILASTNDALDLSGSAVSVESLRIVGAGDKGLSVGERSELVARGVHVERATTAVASKDLSRATLEDLEVADSDVGLAAYQKKPEFGPGTLAVTGLALREVATPWLVERGSRVLVDGAAMTSDETQRAKLARIR